MNYGAFFWSLCENIILLCILMKRNNYFGHHTFLHPSQKTFSGRLIFERHSWLDNLLSKCVARGSEVSLLLAGRRRNRWLATCQSHQRHHFTPSTSSTSPSTTWSTWISFTCHLAVTHCQRKSISTNNNTIASKPHHNSQLLHITLQSQVFQGVPGLT